MIIKTNKNSLFFSLRLLGLYLLLLVPYSHAETVSDDALSNEQIFNALDSGAIGDVATIDQYLAQLKNSITVDDLQDYLRLQRAICWNSFDIEKREKLGHLSECMSKHHAKRAGVESMNRETALLLPDLGNQLPEIAKHKTARSLSD